MKLLLAVLLSVALIWLAPNRPSINNQVPARTHHKGKQIVASIAPPPVQVAPAKVEQLTTHEELMTAAGILPEDFGAADYIISHESSWNENATEPTSGAHGLPQALPYSKTGCGWSDAVCQLRWANTYAAVRYGGWWYAQAHWAVHRNW